MTQFCRIEEMVSEEFPLKYLLFFSPGASALLWSLQMLLSLLKAVFPIYGTKILAELSGTK